MSSSQKLDHGNGLEIAIIGMAGRFPGAHNVEQFWRNIRDGVESITFFSEDELLAAGLAREVLRDPNYVKAKGVLEDVEMFDALFFGFNPREAEIMDPQQRIFLECAWSALENAGYSSETYGRPIGMYAGVGMNTYFLNLLSNEEIIRAVGTYQTLIGNDKDYLPTRVSYKLNLKGPGVAVQTACSTSLVAVHLACQSLLSGECSMALAGGVAVTFPHKSGYLYQREGISSPDGHCRAFDAQAQGTVAGNGVGIVVLKRLEDALADGDYIHAVIRGSAINNDGSDKVGYTAPSIEGQAAVIRAAHMMAEVSADTITYVEAHGTGTTLGDPIEVAALTQAFRHSTTRTQFCALASVKTNIGHLDAAAGVSGLIKAALALRHKQLPPSLHFEEANPNIGFAQSPFYVNRELAEWSVGAGMKRRAGVSSFGIGGTNAHLVLEEAPAVKTSTPARAVQLLALSAKTSSALDTATMNLASHLKAHPEANLADVAYTLQVGRRAFSHRRIAVCRKGDDAAQILDTLDEQRVLTGMDEPRRRPIVMMFPGQGAQYAGMGKSLYHAERVFREEVDRCAKILMPYLHMDVRTLLLADEAHLTEAHEQLKQTQIAQPTLFTVEYALARQWISWGVRPQAMVGHSVGEYTAACLAGVIKLEDALMLIAARGRLMQSLPPGAMLSVPLTESEVERLLDRHAGGTLSLASVNAASLCVVSGALEEIEKVERELDGKGIASKRLHTSHAFHSKMMEPMLEEFGELVSRIELQPPQTPYLSNVTGRWIMADEATDPQYWVRHIRQPVLFSAAVAELMNDSEQVLLEVGPGSTLTTLVKQQSRKHGSQVILSSLGQARGGASDEEMMLQALGRQWLAGVEVEWDGLYASGRRRRIELPEYPFERQRYWIEAQAKDSVATRQPKMGKRSDITEWFYAPLWKQSLPATLCPMSRKAEDGAEQAFPLPAREPQRYLVFVDECGIGAQIADGLQQQGNEVVTVVAGEQFQQLDKQEYVIDPRQQDDYKLLLRKLVRAGQTPQLIAHFWGVTFPYETMSYRAPTIGSLETFLQRGFYSLLFLAQALAQECVTGEAQLSVISNDTQAVSETDELRPEKAMVFGACRVIPQEYTNVTCRNIDITVPTPNTSQEKELIIQLTTELTVSTLNEKSVAYRGQKRWTQTFEPVRLEPPRPSAADVQADHISSHNPTSTPDPRGAHTLPRRLRQGGVYLLTGGTGSIGLALAVYLARTAQARLILVGRSGLSEAEQGADAGRKREQLSEIEKAGGEVLVLGADVGNEEEMREVVRRGRERFGEIHGVIHAAGLVGEQSVSAISETGREQSERMFQAKVYGLLVLERIFYESELDFILLISSLSSILGGIGFTAYAAANIFMDALAQRQNIEGRTPWLTTNWDGWEFGGNHPDAQGISPDTLGVLPQEGIEAFERILHTSGLQQIAVSTTDLPARINRWIELEQRAQSNAANKPSKFHSRPELQITYRAPENDVEQTIVDIWQTLLGIERVGIDDSFFDLGGHSLLATQLISRLRDTFQIELPLRSFFEAPSIASLARAVAQNVEERESKKLEQILQEVEGLTEADLDAALFRELQ